MENTVQDRIVVVLDTAPVRELAHQGVPDWVATFSQMKEDGYRFSIADHACGELINQRSKGSIDNSGFAAMIGCLDAFLDDQFPVIPGERDVLIMIGAELPAAGDWSAAEVSHNAWATLRNQEIHPAGDIGEVLEEDRASWKDLFVRVSKIYKNMGAPRKLNESNDPVLDAVLESLDALASLDPPLSIRFDLKVRYFWRQFVRSQKQEGAYNVSAPKKRNDGIDFGLYTYLAIPALAVTSDRDFHEAISDIPSFQTAWFYRPGNLAECWLRKKRPQPTWPERRGQKPK